MKVFKNNIKMFRVWRCLTLIKLIFTLRVLSKEVTDLEALTKLPTKCTYAYASEMYGADCAGLRLTKIPSLRGGIEILDFSDNKLQEIQADTLSSYTSIRYLYLSDNQIYSIDSAAFAYLSNLVTLDLSKNVILDLPESIFQIPTLRKLYLNENPLLNLRLSNLELSKPIKAPLESLDLSDCKIKVLPDWGILPHMVFYNISHNPLATLDANSFSSMCKLAKVDLSYSIEHLKLCDMRMTITWFQERRVYFQLDDYTKLNSREFENCPRLDIPENLNASYHQCKSTYTKIQNVKTSRRTWLTIGGGLAGFLVGFVLLLYIMHRHNVTQTKRSKKKNKKILSGDQNTTVLLNDVS